MDLATLSSGKEFREIRPVLGVVSRTKRCVLGEDARETDVAHQARPVFRLEVTDGGSVTKVGAIDDVVSADVKAAVLVLEYHASNYLQSQVSDDLPFYRYVLVMLDKTRLLKTDEAAHYLGVTRQTVKDWIRERGLPAKRITSKALRIDPVELEIWLEQQQRENK